MSLPNERDLRPLPISRRELLTRAASIAAGALVACDPTRGVRPDASTPSDAAGRAPNDAATDVPGVLDAPPPACTSPTPGTAPGTFLWRSSANAACNLPAGSTTVLARGATNMTAQVSPDLPPGRTLVVDPTGDVAFVADATAPPFDIERSWTVEIMASPLATIFNRTQATTFGRAFNNTTWYQCIDAAHDGDVIEISPGAINQSIDDCRNYFAFLDNTAMVITKGVTIRSIDGRGRWRLFPRGVAVPASMSGITIFDPSTVGGRKAFVLSGFDIVDQFGTERDAYGVRIRQGASDGATFHSMHESATFRDFKVGKTSGVSGSGFNNGAETLTIEDGHIFDCGFSGYEHNLYISARTLLLRGVRSSRTRGGLDGHIAKLTAVNGAIEGCVFDAAPDGDMSHHIQMKGGGNFVIRGCLFVDSIHNNSAGRGPLNLCREYQSPGLPNFDWWAGLDGNSLLVERNVFIGHYGRPAVYFFPRGHINEIPAAMLRSVDIRDNIGMIADSPTSIAGFPGTAGADYDNRRMWVVNDPLSTASWVERGNTVEPYRVDESAFLDRALFGYRRAQGPIAAPRSIATARFIYPHGAVPRTDAARGLG